MSRSTVKWLSVSSIRSQSWQSLLPCMIIRSKFYSSRSAVQVYCSKFYSCSSAVQVYRSKFFLAVQPWLPSVWSFWRAVQDHPFEILLLPFSRSAVQVYRSKIFLAIQTWFSSVRNFSLAVQPSYQSVRNKLSAIHPFGFIHFKRLRGPFLTRSTAVRFTHLMEIG